MHSSLILPTPDDFAAALGRHTPGDMPPVPGRTNHKRAGVLVPLIWMPEPVAVMTLRTPHLRHHAGEICFPGGRPEPSDPDLEATARREAREELGISVTRILGQLSSMPLYNSDYRLVPYVAQIDAGPLTPEPGEVAKVLRMPLRWVLELPELTGIPFEWEGVTHLSPVFAVEGHLMYGGTAHVFHELLSIVAPLFGRALPPLRAGRLGWEDLLG